LNELFSNNVLKFGYKLPAIAPRNIPILLAIKNEDWYIPTLDSVRKTPTIAVSIQLRKRPAVDANISGKENDTRRCGFAVSVFTLRIGIILISNPIPTTAATHIDKAYIFPILDIDNPIIIPIEVKNSRIILGNDCFMNTLYPPRSKPNATALLNRIRIFAGIISDIHIRIFVSPSISNTLLEMIGDVITNKNVRSIAIPREMLKAVRIVPNN
jgi:hypothetical protein